MKINLSDDLADDLTELRLIGGYESTQGTIKMLVRLYADDFRGRFSAGSGTFSSTRQTNITNISNISHPTPPPLPIDSTEKLEENPIPEW